MTSKGKLTEEDFYALIQPGKIVKFFRGEGNHSNQTRHIRAIVDEQEVVYRVWSKHKQEWIYAVDSLYGFWCEYKLGLLLVGETEAEETSG